MVFSSSHCIDIDPVGLGPCLQSALEMTTHTDVGCPHPDSWVLSFVTLFCPRPKWQTIGNIWSQPYPILQLHLVYKRCSLTVPACGVSWKLRWEVPLGGGSLTETIDLPWFGWQTWRLEVAASTNIIKMIFWGLHHTMIWPHFAPLVERHQISWSDPACLKKTNRKGWKHESNSRLRL